MTASSEQPGGVGLVCYRHGDRPTGLRCTRCDRPACPQCLREASVGHQCVDCVQQGRRSIRQPVTAAGARPVRQPVLVPALIAVNVVVFGITALQARSVIGNSQAPLFREWALQPIATAVTGHWWQLFTSGFLHIGPLHLVVNMVSLWIIGRDLEQVFGRIRFIAIYLVSMVGGGVAVFLLGYPGQAVAGASTALYGLMGCILVAMLRLKLNPRQILITIAFNVVISVTLPGISLLGHVGGLVAGTLATIGIVYAPKDNRSLWQAGSIAALVVLLSVLFVVRDQQLLEAYCPLGC
ncbi:MAG: rhomboid family intramembrane serine protease [Kutzneria sp.]|nr:rhomboid family intramembrane serine protease [Kutzneria sp.]